MYFCSDLLTLLRYPLPRTPRRRRPQRYIALAKLAFNSSGGQARAKADDILHSALRNLHAAAVERGGPEFAAQTMAWLQKQDADHPVLPDWLRTVFKEHEEAVREVLVSPSDERMKVPARRKGTICDSTSVSRRRKL